MADLHLHCTCGHIGLEHHFNLYLGCRGENGRGKCAATGCECKSFKLEPIQTKEDVT